MIVTSIIFYKASSQQFYIRLCPNIVDDLEKERLCQSLNALPAAQFREGLPDVNLLYFQEFEEPDTKGLYYNINGDKQIYDLITGFEKQPEYII